MTTALVLMKAMPFTKGHEDLIRFASSLAGYVEVLIDTHPDEPFIDERVAAVQEFARKTAGPYINVSHIEVIPQVEDDDPNFWDMWKDILEGYKFDMVVASEPYGQQVADLFGVDFFIYDPNREMDSTKAENIRSDVSGAWEMMAESMRRKLVTTVTVFGAESTGKTTMSRSLARAYLANHTIEWARPYLEFKGPEISVKSMTDIWKGQKALQEASLHWSHPSPVMIRDTDLYSTIGYWEQPHWQDALGPVPERLIADAEATKSDLYLIMKSNIPFEEDPIRYGGDRRESSDEYWIGIAEKYNLNYVVIDKSHRFGREMQSSAAIDSYVNNYLEPLNYNRNGA